MQAPLESIQTIVDKDYAAIESEALHSLVARMLPSTLFRGLILLLIVANAIIIVIQTDERLVCAIIKETNAKRRNTSTLCILDNFSLGSKCTLSSNYLRHDELIVNIHVGLLESGRPMMCKCKLILKIKC